MSDHGKNEINLMEFQPWAYDKQANQPYLKIHINDSQYWLVKSTKSPEANGYFDTRQPIPKEALKDRLPTFITYLVWLVLVRKAQADGFKNKKIRFNLRDLILDIYQKYNNEIIPGSVYKRIRQHVQLLKEINITAVNTFYDPVSGKRIDQATFSLCSEVAVINTDTADCYVIIHDRIWNSLRRNFTAWYRFDYLKTLSPGAAKLYMYLSRHWGGAQPLTRKLETLLIRLGVEKNQRKDHLIRSLDKWIAELSENDGYLSAETRIEMEGSRGGLDSVSVYFYLNPNFSNVPGGAKRDVLPPLPFMDGDNIEEALIARNMYKALAKRAALDIDEKTAGKLIREYDYRRKRGDNVNGGTLAVMFKDPDGWVPDSDFLKLEDWDKMERLAVKWFESMGRQYQEMHFKKSCREAIGGIQGDCAFEELEGVGFELSGLTDLQSKEILIREIVRAYQRMNAKK